MKIYRSYSCAVTQHQCNAALGLGKMHSPLLCNTGFGQNAFPTAQCCSARQADSVIASTPMGNCCSHSCAATQQQCTATLLLATCIPGSLVLLQLHRLISAVHAGHNGSDPDGRSSAVDSAVMQDHSPTAGSQAQQPCATAATLTDICSAYRLL